MNSKFRAGHVVATPGAIGVFGDDQHDMSAMLHRHLCGDWGVVPGEDRQTNEEALVDGSRLLSAYQYGDQQVWIITEAADKNGDRAATTILLPSEY